MSIASEITRIKTAIEAAYSKVSERGGTIPSVSSERVIADLASAIDTIPAGVSPLGTPTLTSSRARSGITDLCTLYISHVDGADKFFVCRADASRTPGDYDLELSYIDSEAGVTEYIVPSWVSNRDQVAFVIAYNSTTGAMSYPGNYSFYQIGELCFVKGTAITMADGSEKPVEDISYDDELAVWNFDDGVLSASRPLWIKKESVAGYSFVNEFESGKILKTTGKSSTGWGHRGFNVDRASFTYFPQSVGDRFYMANGTTDRLVSSRYVQGDVLYYNIITDRHMNLFANGALTSCSLNNGMYPFDVKAMKFEKCPRPTRSIDEFRVPERYYTGLRLGEQRGAADEVHEYINNLMGSAK